MSVRPFVRLLRLAYSGELAAAIAYHGHAASVRDPVEKSEIRRIEEQEIEHRARLGHMLEKLGAAPDPARERRATLIGTAIALFCRVGGWFLPMYGAGRLERRNVAEYEIAARVAARAGHPEFAGDLAAMGRVEADHERYFLGKAASHPLYRLFAQKGECAGRRPC